MTAVMRTGARALVQVVFILNRAVAAVQATVPAGVPSAG
jgi:hypothetical protein